MSTTTTTGPSAFNLNDPTIKTIVAVVVAGLLAISGTLFTQRNNAMRAADDAIAAKTAIEAETRTSRETYSNLAAAKATVDETLKASTAAMNAANEQAKNALAARDAAEAATRAAKDLAAQATTAKQAAEKALADARGQLDGERKAKQALEKELADMRAKASAAPAKAPAAPAGK